MAAKILIAEDDADLRKIFSDYLQFSGFHVTCAGDGNEAIACLEAATPDVLIVDVGIPGKSGLEVIQYVRDREVFRQVYIIVVTGNHAAESTHEAQLADFFMVKPVLITQLTALIKRILQQRINPSSTVTTP